MSLHLDLSNTFVSFLPFTDLHGPAAAGAHLCGREPATFGFPFLTTPKLHSCPLQNCMDLLLPALTNAGVDLQTLLDLTSCPTTSSCLNVGSG